MFHWQGNLYFGRKTDGSVRVLKFSGTPSEWPNANKEYEVPELQLDVSIPAAEWASITSSVSKSGEPQNYQRAVELHGA